MKPKPKHYLSLAAAGYRAAAYFMVHLHGRHVVHMDGHAVVGGDDDVGDFLHVGRQADALDQQRFAGAHDLPAADILVVGRQRLEELFEGDSVFDQAFRLGHHVVLLLEAAPAIRPPPRRAPCAARA